MTHNSIKSRDYYSFMLRLRSLEAEGEAAVRISLEQVDTRRTEYFTSLPELMDYLQRLVAPPLSPPPGGDEGSMVAEENAQEKRNPSYPGGL